MLIQTKPKPAGTPVEAVQFLGDASVHPDIFQETRRNKTAWRVRTCEDRGSLGISIGDWLVGQGPDLLVVPSIIFDRDWQRVSGG